MSPGRYLSLLIFTLTICWTKAQLAGNPLACENEGEKVVIPHITVDPCISCFCRDQKVECARESCPSLDECALVITSLGYDCCDKCKGCSFNGERYESGSSWRSTDDVCEVFQCQEGVVTSSEVQCSVTCENPIIKDGHCCPSCEGCSYGDETHGEGEIFPSPDDPCIECTCENGSVRCEKRACPVLSCPESQQETPPGGCCPACAARRRVFDLANRCLFRNSLYLDAKSFVEDACTSCLCLDATVICRRETCPILDCDDYDYVQGECCPKCRQHTCSFEDKEYVEGDVWTTAEDPCIQCTCFEGGNVTCEIEQCDNIVDCPRDHTLKLPEGECCPRCIENMGICTVFGDPHYKTFDGRLYNFQGTCKYILVSDCEEESFMVRVRNDARNTASFSWTQSVHVTFGDYDIKLQQQLNVKYKRRRITLPYEEPDVFSVRLENQLLTLTTILGFIVTWDGDSYLEVQVPPSFKDKLCGLCGNYNGNMWDDYTTRGGVVKNHAPRFAETWRTGRRSICGRPERKRIKSKDSVCEEGSKNRLKAEKKCKILKSKVFEDCMEVVDVGPYFSSCVTDVCECPSKQDCQCEATLAYHRQCIREGVNIKWGKRHVCKVEVCPRGGVYDICAPACQRSCTNRNDVNQCRKICQPGCTCPEDTVLHDNECIKPEECPDQSL
ncbi:BMP-binding endothelial regulator protein-like [Glandiceps talaboti]